MHAEIENSDHALFTVSLVSLVSRKAERRVLPSSQPISSGHLPDFFGTPGTPAKSGVPRKVSRPAPALCLALSRFRTPGTPGTPCFCRMGKPAEQEHQNVANTARENGTV